MGSALTYSRPQRRHVSLRTDWRSRCGSAFAKNFLPSQAAAPSPPSSSLSSSCSRVGWEGGSGVRWGGVGRGEVVWGWVGLREDGWGWGLDRTTTPNMAVVLCHPTPALTYQSRGQVDVDQLFILIACSCIR